jgi:hypothetical protein
MNATTIEGTIAQSTREKIADKISITSRSGSGISKSGSFNLDVIQSAKTFTGDIEIYRTHHFTYSVSINNHFTNGETHCYRKWVMYYYRQNKNKTWAKQWSYITVDSTLMDSIIGSEKRIEIETTITDELLFDLRSAIGAINNAVKENK